MITGTPDVSDKYKRVMNDLYSFYLYYVINHFNKKIIKAPHIKKLSRKLMRMYRGDYRKLTVSMPPRHSKSSLITLAFPLWLICRDPTLNIMVINSTFTLSESFGIRIRDLFEVYGEQLGLRVSDKKHASGWLMFEDLDGNLTGGSIRLIGIGGQITGFDADWIIVDDLVKGISDCTPTTLATTREYFDGVIMQRVEPHTRLIVLGTIWHSDDVLSYIRKEHGDEYELLAMPAYNRNDETLWPNRYNLDFFKTREKEMGTRLFQALYMCNPLDETGDYFNIDNIFYSDPYDAMSSHIIGKCRSWDLAYTSEDVNKSSDYTAGAYVYKNYKGEYILSDLVYGRFGEDNLNKIRATSQRDKPETPILIETGTVGAASGELYKVYSKKLQGYNVRQSLPIGSKVDRAFKLQQAILDHRFGITIENDELRETIIKQLQAFPFGKNDDIVDSISYAIEYLEPISLQSSIGVSGKNNRRRFRR